MNNYKFWENLKTNWSTLQIQATETKFDSELLKQKMHKQIERAKKIRQTHYPKNDFLNFSEEDDD